MPSILIIDDNEEILSANRANLTGQGFNVTCAETGIKALACLNENKYDCIVLDVLLPDLDGYAAGCGGKAMKKLSSFLPVALTIIILAALYVFMCLPRNQGTVSAVYEDDLY